MTEARKVLLQIGAAKMERLVEFSTMPPWTLRLATVGGEVEYSCERDDLFECLISLRADYLEPLGGVILCNGARLDVWPSRMSRQMSGGRKAYAMRLGEPARRCDMVDIFEPSPASEQVVDVAAQQAFYRQWIESLGLAS